MNPFNRSSGWLPVRGDRVVIYAGDGTSEWIQFTGLIDKTTGDIGSGYQSTIIDDLDRLITPFSHVPLLRVMTPIVRGAAEYRAAGLSHLYYVDAALRVAGFFATPPAESRQILSVPAQSSMWPEAGIMTDGLVGGVDGGPWAAFYDGPDGVVMADLQNIYSPRLAFPMTEPVRFGLTVAPEHSGNTTVKAYYGATDYVELAVAGSRTVIARLNGVEICSLAMGSAVRVSLLVKAGAWTLRTSAGATASGAATNPTTAVLDRIVITADASSRVAGFHACHTSTSTENLYTSFTPSARYQMDTTAHVGLMDAGPTIEPTTCLDVLQKISQATLTAMWIDELGVFNWAPSIVLRGRPSLASLTTEGDVTELGWEDSLLAVRSRVELSHEIPAVSKSRWDTILFHEGGGGPLDSGQVQAEFIKTPDGEDWVGIDTTIYVLKTGEWSAYNSRQGSFGGGVFTSSGATTSEAGLTFSVALEVVDNRTLKFTQSVGPLPADVKFEPVTSPTDPALWERMRDKPLPVIRGFAKTQWAEAAITGATSGPSWAPVLTHELGPWANRDDGTAIIPQRIADYIASQVSAPSPTITSLAVIPDPRRQLGDVITISSAAYMGAVLTALVVGIDTAHDDALTQQLAVRIISIATTHQTYEAWDAASPGTLTYGQWDALVSTPDSYATFDASKGD